ncbi:unnamed protein product [Gongylonema pulchrum]|uniref:TPR_REGION domain-containing protein n=1 Tax=Gongylonema pulchrum TaxID=637853 RepID=A0A183EJ72_9BILA|nr:unnamed protein product [Gongylonema pulchrum]
MLAAGVIERKIQSNDELLNEKCASYLDEVIAQRRNWAVQASALLQRSELEWTRMRRAERACMQMEALSKLVNGVEIKKIDKNAMKGRLKLLLASGLKPYWYVDTVYAGILRSLGCIALEKAEHLVRELIEKNPDEPTYWCLLGDILQQPEAYEKAIQVSNGRSFRAYRSLGMLMLRRGHYDVSFEHLKRSLELQPINVSFDFATFLPQLLKESLCSIS